MATGEKGLVTELVEALRRAEAELILFRREGAYCAADFYALGAVQDALTRATPEAVRKADAAPEMYQALLPLAFDSAGRPVSALSECCWQCDRTRDAIAAIAKAEGKP